MLHKLLVATAMLSVASPAYAREWWVINNDTGQCLTTEAEAQESGFWGGLTPAAALNSLRVHGDTVYPQAERDDSGNITMIALQDYPANGAAASVMYFFTSEAYCEVMLSIKKKDGTIVDPNDMN